MDYQEFIWRQRIKSIIRNVIIILGFAFIIYNLVVPESKATSLWGKKGYYFTEHKALSKGDIVTIEISESVRALHSSSRDNDKNIELAGGNRETSLFTGTNLLSFLPFFKPQLRTQYSGKNDVRAQGMFMAKISAVIEKVLPNGNFYIVGEKNVQINNELQVIRIEGEIRPDDISANNTISSDKIAKAKVFYKSELNLSSDPKPNPVVKGLSKIVDLVF